MDICMCMYVYMDAGACGSQQMLDPLELEL